MIKSKIWARARPPAIYPWLLELETAKDILEEILHAWHSDVEETIQRRLYKGRLWKKTIAGEVPLGRVTSTNWPELR